MSPSAQRVQEALRRRGFPHLEVVELPASTRTAVEAEVGQIVKSLVFVGERAYLFLVSGKNRLDLRKAEALVGGPLRRATPEEVRALTGFAIGGVPPVGHTTPLPAYLDEDLLGYPEVWAAGGTPRALFRATPKELLALTGAQVADLKEG